MRKNYFIRNDILLKKFINFSSEKSFKNIKVTPVFLIKKYSHKNDIDNYKKKYIQYLNTLTRIQREETV